VGCRGGIMRMRHQGKRQKPLQLRLCGIISQSRFFSIHLTTQFFNLFLKILRKIVSYMLESVKVNLEFGFPSLFWIRYSMRPSECRLISFSDNLSHMLYPESRRIDVETLVMLQGSVNSYIYPKFDASPWNLTATNESL